MITQVTLLLGCWSCGAEVSFVPERFLLTNYPTPPNGTNLQRWRKSELQSLRVMLGGLELESLLVPLDNAQRPWFL
jgi:hypothetical protein